MGPLHHVDQLPLSIEQVIGNKSQRIGRESIVETKYNRIGRLVKRLSLLQLLRWLSLNLQNSSSPRNVPDHRTRMPMPAVC